MTIHKRFAKYLVFYIDLGICESNFVDIHNFHKVWSFYLKYHILGISIPDYLSMFLLF